MVGSDLKDKMVNVRRIGIDFLSITLALKNS